MDDRLARLATDNHAKARTRFDESDDGVCDFREIGEPCLDVAIDNFAALLLILVNRGGLGRREDIVRFDRENGMPIAAL